MTQEQLAMLLGVSRQSVSKWEAEKAYPEMDKLLKICALFGCTLDELVSGDLTARPADASASMPSGSTTQDVTGYDEAMRRFAWKLPFGVTLILIGLAFAALLGGTCTLPGTDPDTYAAIAVFVGVGIGLAFILPASFERSTFIKAHPFIEDFYTTEQKDAARRSTVTGLVVGIALFMAGIIAVLLLQSDEQLAGCVFFLFVAAGTFLVIHGPVLGRRCDIASYNDDALSELDEDQIDALGDPVLQTRARRAKRESGIYGVIMCLATALGLLLLFVPVFGAQEWFWVVWPIGAVLCGGVATYRRSQGIR